MSAAPLWRWAARRIAGNPRLVDWLIKRAQRTPYFHIDDYMGRWWLIQPRDWLPFSIRIHHIKRADDGRHLHDHPFDYRTIVLRGGYVEEDVFGELHFRSAGDTVDARAQTFHRIHTVSPDGVWTLFIMGRRINSWGFMVGGRKIYYRDYLGLPESSE